MRTPSERVAQGLPAEGKKPRAKKPKYDGEAKDLGIVEVPETKANGKANDLSIYDTDGDLVDIWERRMLHPNQKPTHPIRLQTPGMHIRWINLSNTGRYQRARYEEGWAPVRRQELVDEREIYGVSFTVEGYVCRGEKQQEMLMKIPEAVYKKIRLAKLAEVNKSNRTIKERIKESGARHFGERTNQNRGDEIADAMDHFKGDIKFGTEQVEPDAEEFDSVQSSIGE